MNITLASMKGGVAKTTSAIHLAAFFADLGPTALVDGDPNGSATNWAKRGTLSFPVIGLYKAAGAATKYQHVIMDTKARPQTDELRDLVDNCDLLVIPTTPDPLSLEGMMLTLTTLRSIGATNFRVLLTIVPPEPIPEGREARKELEAAEIPTFARSVRRLMAFQRAAAEGTTVGQVRDRNASLGALDYEYVGEEIQSAVAARSHSVRAS